MYKRLSYFRPEWYYVSIYRDLPDVFEGSEGSTQNQPADKAGSTKRTHVYIVACCSTPPYQNTTATTTATAKHRKSVEMRGRLLSESAALGRACSWKHSDCLLQGDTDIFDRMVAGTRMVVAS